MKRFFAFGCSFTRYEWPTWADIIGNEFEHYENWGNPGAGNFFIFNAIIECHLKNKLTENDTVAIMWSNFQREDRYIKRKWVTPGSILYQQVFSKEFVKEVYDDRGYYIRDFSYIYAIVNLLNSIGCKYYMTSMVDINNIDQFDTTTSKEIDDLLIYYKDILKLIRPSVHNVIFNYDWWSRPYINPRGGNLPPLWYTPTERLQKKYHRDDSHPLPLEHLEYVEKILPEFLISEKTKNSVKEIDEYIRNKSTWNHFDWAKSLKSFKPLSILKDRW
jgi:hypothetical protein